MTVTHFAIFAENEETQPHRLGNEKKSKKNAVAYFHFCI